METVKTFEIRLDLDNCPRLYDYGRGEYIEKPDDGWDWAAIADVSRRAENSQIDETTHSMIRKMDKALVEKGFFEKEKSGKKQAEEGNFFDSFASDSSMTLPRRVLPIYKPGDIIKGTVFLELNEAVQAERLQLKFKGHASTCVYVYNGQTSYPDVGEQVFVNEEIDLWRKEGIAADSDTFSLMKASTKTGSSLSPGQHQFPFEVVVPTDARQSVPPMPTRCMDWAHINYYVKATVNMGKVLKRGNILCARGIWIWQEKDIAADKDNLTPLKEETVQETGLFSSGKIVCRVTLPSRGFVRCTTIPIQLEVDNQSGGEIQNVKAFIKMKIHYRSKKGSWHGSNSGSAKTTRVSQGPIASGMCPQIAMELPLDFRADGLDGNLVPVGTLDDCEIIDVKYEVCIVLKRSGLHRNVNIDIPVYIGSINSAAAKETIYPKLAGFFDN